MTRPVVLSTPFIAVNEVRIRVYSCFIPIVLVADVAKRDHIGFTSSRTENRVIHLIFLGTFAKANQTVLGHRVEDHGFVLGGSGFFLYFASMSTGTRCICARPPSPP